MQAEPSLHPMSHRPILALFAGLFILAGCRKDLRFTEDGVTLDFSRDTILFDTVFTTLTTSVTKRFTVRNPDANAVKVDIVLVGGPPSPFRINVDGLSGDSFEDVEILGKDSIFVFVEVLPAAGGVNTPFLVEDFIRFNANGVEGSVLLQVWGQDAVVYRPDQFVQGFPPFSYIAGGFDQNGVQICGETVVWTPEKPILILGYAVVDSCNALVIQPGTRIHVHGGGGLWVYKYGRITAQGLVDQPIVFQGDRLEPAYQDLPGQWDRIWINEGEANQDHVLEHVQVRNALIGIQCETFPLDPLAPTSAAKLVLNNVSIRNCSAAGILSRNYRITSNNLLVADAGQFCMALTGGGEYFFNHTTVSNFWSYDVRNDPAFLLTNTYQGIDGSVQVRDITNSTFQNGIIHGANSNEFLIELEAGATTQYTFTNFLLRTDQPTNDAFHFPDQTSIIRNLNPAFVGSGDQHLTAASPCIDRGTFSTIEALTDLDGQPRGFPPDLGCYEFVP